MNKMYDIHPIYSPNFFTEDTINFFKSQYSLNELTDDELKSEITKVQNSIKKLEKEVADMQAKHYPSFSIKEEIRNEEYYLGNLLDEQEDRKKNKPEKSEKKKSEKSEVKKKEEPKKEDPKEPEEDEIDDEDIEDEDDDEE